MFASIVRTYQCSEFFKNLFKFLIFAKYKYNAILKYTQTHIAFTLLSALACLLFFSHDGYCADDPCVDPVAEICEKYGKPLFIHSGHPPFSLPWQIGLLAERHPHLPIVMIHMGHAHGVYVDAAITMAKKYDNIWLETSGTSMSIQIANAYNTVGHEKVMFGIDSPFHAPTVEIQKIMACGVDDEGLENIFYHNAAKFMGLK